MKLEYLHINHYTCIRVIVIVQIILHSFIEIIFNDTHADSSKRRWNTYDMKRVSIVERLRCSNLGGTFGIPL